MVRALTAVPTLAERLGNLVLADRTTDSPATRDALGEAHLSWDYGIAAMSAAIDHLQTWSDLYLVARRLPRFAEYTLLRSTLEAVVTCRWLVDPSKSPRERVRRGGVLHLSDLADRNKFEQAVKPPPQRTSGKSASERIAQYQRLMVDAGFYDEIEIKNVTPLAVTDRFALYAYSTKGDGAQLYRLLSSFAHNRLYQVAGTSIIEEQIKAPSGDGWLVKHSANEALVQSFTVTAVDAIIRALEELVWYGGHGPKPRR